MASEGTALEDFKCGTSSFTTTGGGNRASMVDRYLMQKYTKLPLSELSIDEDGQEALRITRP